MIFNGVNRPVNSTNKANVFKKVLTFISNFSVNFSVVVDISMNRNTKFCGKIPSPKVLYHIEASQLICRADQSSDLCMAQVFEKKKKKDFQMTYYVNDFCNILPRIIKVKVIQTFKKLLKSESVNNSDPINSVYLWLSFSILLSRFCTLKVQT